jgi:hypothetical protein
MIPYSLAMLVYREMLHISAVHLNLRRIFMILLF